MQIPFSCHNTLGNHQPSSSIYNSVCFPNQVLMETSLAWLNYMAIADFGTLFNVLYLCYPFSVGISAYTYCMYCISMHSMSSITIQYTVGCVPAKMDVRKTCYVYPLGGQCLSVAKGKCHGLCPWHFQGFPKALAFP